MVATSQIDIIQAALNQLTVILKSRLQQPIEGELPDSIWQEALQPEWSGFYHYLTQQLAIEKMGLVEYVTILIALAPHVMPHFFDEIVRDALPEGGDFPQLGGIRGKNHRGVLPTGETALFILFGEQIEKRTALQTIFDDDHWFHQKQILWLAPPPPGEPLMSGQIVMPQETVDLLVRNKISKPKFGSDFPAKRIETYLTWDDVVLNKITVTQLEEIKNWLEFGPVLMKELGMYKKLKPGYRSLFHGPPGTGKTLTANLLGKHFKKDVYKIDLSLVVSKYIGETEKNLSKLFNKAENKEWILFFDEADALFGKRTNVKDAHDKYANQEVSYLLQRIEDYDGLVILASNFKSNIDEAFLRRFQSIIHFPMPTPQERMQIWQKGFPTGLPPAETTDLKEIARRYNLTGANIMNIIQYCCLEALSQKGKTVSPELLQRGIKREFGKEGKIF